MKRLNLLTGTYGGTRCFRESHSEYEFLTLKKRINMNFRDFKKDVEAAFKAMIVEHLFIVNAKTLSILE